MTDTTDKMIRVDPRLHRLLKRIGVDLGQPIRELVNGALFDWAEAYDPEVARALEGEGFERPCRPQSPQPVPH